MVCRGRNRAAGELDLYCNLNNGGTTFHRRGTELLVRLNQASDVMNFKVIKRHNTLFASSHQVYGYIITLTSLWLGFDLEDVVCVWLCVCGSSEAGGCRWVCRSGLSSHRWQYTSAWIMVLRICWELKWIGPVEDGGRLNWGEIYYMVRYIVLCNWIYT